MLFGQKINALKNIIMVDNSWTLAFMCAATFIASAYGSDSDGVIMMTMKMMMIDDYGIVTIYA